VSFNDALWFGSPLWAVVSELERRGFDARTDVYWRVPTTRHRVIDPDDADAELVIATGRNVDRWRTSPAAVEVGYADLRSDDERAEFGQLRGEIIDELRDHGLDDLVELVDGNLFGLTIEPRVSRDVQLRAERMLELGAPVAVFLVPPGTVA
jgi:hypothetical protein